jgi:hypothetical protein
VYSSEWEEELRELVGRVTWDYVTVIVSRDGGGGRKRRRDRRMDHVRLVVVMHDNARSSTLFRLNLLRDSSPTGVKYRVI